MRKASRLNWPGNLEQHSHMALDLQVQAQEWASATKVHDARKAWEALKVARRHLANRKQRDLAWFTRALDSAPSEQAWYVAAAISQQSPPSLLLPLVRANARCCDASVHWFLDAAVAAFGRVEMVKAILALLRSGSIIERTGVVYSLYWSRRLSPAKRDPPTDMKALAVLFAEVKSECEALLPIATDTNFRRALEVELGRD